MKVLFIGDIVGKPGREAIARLLFPLRQEKGIDLVVANAENAAGGSGLTPSVVDELFTFGCDVLTSGDHIWKRQEVLNIIDHPFLLRPANLSQGIPGKGFCIIEKQGLKIGVVNLQGRVFMQPIECPFKTIKEIISQIKSQASIILIDIHAEATSEKLALAHFLDGEVTAIVGTHTHVQTSDERILSGGTAYITDLGMTGPQDSVIGRKKEKVIERFITGMPTRFEIGISDIQLQGALVQIDSNTAKAVSIERIQRRLLDSNRSQID
jgi:metallophosphoesterase (TIGR00282 family)